SYEAPAANADSPFNTQIGVAITSDAATHRRSELATVERQKEAKGTSRVATGEGKDGTDLYLRYIKPLDMRPTPSASTESEGFNKRLAEREKLGEGKESFARKLRDDADKADKVALNGREYNYPAQELSYPPAKGEG